MGVEISSFYTVRCNKCKCLLEDYTGDLGRLTTKRYMAEELAVENGFTRIGKNTWLCPNCKNTVKSF